MAQYAFGSGFLYGIKSGSNPTPVQFGALQDVNIDITFSIKELFSSKQFPVAIGRGTGKITGKADFGQFNAQAFNDLFFGETSLSSGRVVSVNGEAQTITANVVNVTHNGSNFSQDLGVVYAANGGVLTNVAASPVGAQYVLTSNGLYTFNNSQNNLPVLVSYQYTDSTTGSKIVLANQALGSFPQFAVALNTSFNSKLLTLNLNACMSSKLGLSTKLEDFTIPAFEFAAFADSGGNIGTLSLDE